MQYSKKGIQLTEGFEGCRLTSYQDTGGVWTIGYGHTHLVGPGMTCTQEQAEIWLRTDMAVAETGVQALVKIPLTQGEYDALVDFAFNCGVGNLRVSTLLKLVNTGDFAHAAAEFEKWDHVNSQVVAGLLRRRLAEEAEFKTPDTPQSPQSA
jgi:lysozyme